MNNSHTVSFHCPDGLKSRIKIAARRHELSSGEFCRAVLDFTLNYSADHLKTIMAFLASQEASTKTARELMAYYHNALCKYTEVISGQEEAVRVAGIPVGAAVAGGAGS
jgi:plasmid stability protein